MTRPTWTRSAIIAAALATAALPAAWAAPGDPAAPVTPAPTAPAPAADTTNVRGQVTAVDATAKTITLQGRNQTTTVLHVNDATKYLMDATAALTDLKTGQTVRVMGQTTGNTVAARFIQVVAPAEAAQPATAGRGGRRFGVQGVVATTTPTLTITTDDKQTDTVTTDATTMVTTPKDATLADVKADEYVTATATGTGDSENAVTVHVLPAGMRGGGRRGGGGAPPAPAPAQ